MKIAIAGVALTVVFLGASVLAGRMGLFYTSTEDLRARYAQDASQFIAVDGVPLRYKDEGGGHPIVLIHGAFGNLNMWNDWAEVLTGDYRVIRIDDPPEGLSGPDPSGRFGHDRNGELVDALANELGLDRFAIGGTSRGAVVAYRYTAKHPENVTHLILVNTPVLPQQGPTSPPFLRFARWIATVLGDTSPSSIGAPSSSPYFLTHRASRRSW